jgi:hypothetical protein
MVTVLLDTNEVPDASSTVTLNVSVPVESLFDRSDTEKLMSRFPFFVKYSELGSSPAVLLTGCSVNERSDGLGTAKLNPSY